jgi:Xaa-Pro dipeptidase
LDLPLAAGGHAPRIYPARRHGAGGIPAAALGPGALALGEWRTLGLGLPDLDAMRSYRLGRVQAELRRVGIPAILLTDPLNIRYATDSANMQIWCMHNPVRCAFVGADGPVVIFDFHGCGHLSAHLPLVDEVRHARSLAYFTVGEAVPEQARRWAAEIDDLLRRAGGAERRLAVDALDHTALHALEALGIRIEHGHGLMERARVLKSADEIGAMRCALAACEAGMRAMRQALVPGISEQELWAVLHSSNIARGGEWIETRLLSSGPRTNPWFQECSSRQIEAGELVAFDTDLIGAYGYCADISRTWRCGEARWRPEQRRLLEIAKEQIAHNVALLGPDRMLLEIDDRAFVLPEDCRGNRYSVILHGVGLCDEYPCVYYPEDRGDLAYDLALEPGMVLCVESYVGCLGGGEGVKLEEQVLITETGTGQLSTFPLDDPG